MTVISSTPAISKPQVIANETKQSALVSTVAAGAVGGVLGFGIGGPFRGGLALTGVLGGAAVGASLGLARGSVDSVTGRGVLPALAQTGAGIGGAIAGGVGGVMLMSKLPITRGMINHSSGIPLLFTMGSMAIGGVAALAIAPVLDKLS